jgi:cytochrome oxidase assembly protein ShyY1
LGDVYRFLLTRRWLGFAALMLALAATMVGLGSWQLSRYHERNAINARIDAATRAQPVPLTQILSPDQPPPAGTAWTRVSVTGRYDQPHEIFARDRSVNDAVGYEVLIPLVLPDGSAILVDRGWLPPASSGATMAPPAVPAAPGGDVTVVGRIHLPESRADSPRSVDSRTEVRRIAPVQLAAAVPRPLYGGYLLLDSQRPVPNDTAFVTIPSDHQDATMNAGYVVQWWAFALITLAGFGWAARREALGPNVDPDLSVLDQADFPEAPVSPPV